MNKSIRIAMNIMADYKYVYDPNHDDRPDGMWNRTNSGWSQSNGETSPSRNVIQQNAPAKKDAPKTDSVTSVKEEEHSGDHASAPEPVRKNSQNGQPNDADEPVRKNSQNGQQTDTENDTLFDEGANDGFVTDEEGKEEEKQETKHDGDAVEEIADDDLFDDANKGKYLDPDMYDQHIEQLKSFIEKYDEGEGKENDVTFKAIASNLDWDSTEEVKAFAGHCNKKGLDGADDVLAFLYFQHQDDEEKFDKIIADMK